MRVLALAVLLAFVVSCASAPHKSAEQSENKVSTERTVKLCAYNFLVGVMLLPTHGINGFRELCEENETTKGVTL